MLFDTLSAFALFLLLAAGFRFIINRRGKDNKEALNQYLEKEQAANYARKKPVDTSYFYQFDPARYLLKDSTAAEKQQAAVKKLSKLTMLKFEPPKTNLEIKKEFGYANLEHIVSYEENWHRFFAALTAWAEELLKADNPADAETVLKNAIADGCDLTKAFIMLADIYYNKKDKESLTALKQRAAQLGAYQRSKAVAAIEAHLNNL
jgi:hypothetical protein